MQSVTLKTSDGVIWNETQAAIDLIAALSQGPVSVFLNNEGPCCHTTGIDRLLDSVREYTKSDESQVTIITSNQLPSSKYREIRNGFVELELAKKISLTKNNVPSTLTKRFGLFVGRSNWARLGLACHLHNNYADISNITYHYDPRNNFFKDNFGLEALITKHWDQSSDIFEFLQHIPITKVQREYPILWNVDAYDLDHLYRDVFCEIICETYFTGRVFFFTEKLMRCILNRRPFVVQGPQYFLKNLKKLGFKTFDQWWDEGYSDDCPDGMLGSIKQNIDWIAEQSSHTISDWYREMQPTLDHNFKVLQNLTNQAIINTKFEYYDQR